MDPFSSYLTAPLALILSVPLTFFLFQNYPPYRAAFLAQLIALLTLPVGYFWEIRGFTVLDKATIPLLTAFIACAFIAPREFRHMRINGLTLVFMLGIVLGPFGTAVTNPDPRIVVKTFMPGLTLNDGFAITREFVFTFILPFLLGRMLVRQVSQVEGMLRPLVVAFLIYSLPMLFEIRMSPQLHNDVYGYAPYQFSQQARAGGYRPTVFVGHGLPLAIITSFGAFASAVLWYRGRRIQNLPPAAVTAYLAVIVALCKTLSAMLYGATGALTTFFTSPKTQLRIAMVIAAIVLTYPMLRSYELFPTQFLGDLSSSASEERHESLTFRFENEDLLLAHARERMVFGWGSYGRNRVFEEEEGRDISVTDGLWVILIGTVGAVGFLSVFGLMLLPVFQAPFALRNIRAPGDQRMLSALALLVALNWADSLPNALSGGALMIFMTGAFSGVVATYRKPPPPQRARRKPAVPAAGSLGPIAPLR